MTEMIASERFRLLMEQEQIGRRLRAEMVLQDVMVMSVADEMGLNRSVLSQYLGGFKPWAGGLEDFEARVREGITKVVQARVSAA